MLARLVVPLALLMLAVLQMIDMEANVWRQTDLPDLRASDEFWTAPWVLDGRGSPLRALRHTMQPTSDRSLEIQLDDGSRAMLRVESKPCATGDDCAPLDCGCPLPHESYWIEVVDRAGAQVARLHLWAAYGVFDIVPLDLIDGPGEELIIIRIPAHASPPVGHDLKIWKLGRSRPVELIELVKVAGVLDSLPFGCARWRTRLLVDAGSAKPRTIRLRTDVSTSTGGGSTVVCSMQQAEQEEPGALKAGGELRFEGGQYRRQLR